MDGALICRRLPGEHIHIHRGLAGSGDGIGRDERLGPEHHIDGEQVLGSEVGPGLREGRDVLVHPVAECRLQGFLGLVQSHRSAVNPALKLVEGRAYHQRDVVGDGGESRLERLLEQHFAVRGGAEAPHHRRTRRAGADAGGHRPLPGRDELPVGDVLELLHLVRAEAELLHHCPAELLGHSLGVDVEDGAAHYYRLVEEAFCRRHTHQCPDLAAASGLAEDGDVGRVSAECLDIVTDPFEGLHYVQHPDHSGMLVFLPEGGEVQESEDVEPVVQAHDDDILLGEAHSGVAGGRARVEASAVYPQHHGLAGLGIRRPDVQHAGILLRHHVLGHFAPAVALHHLRPEMVADHHGVPFVHRKRGHKPFNLSIGDAQESHSAFLLDAFDLAVAGADHQRVGGGARANSRRQGGCCQYDLVQCFHYCLALGERGSPKNEASLSFSSRQNTIKEGSSAVQGFQSP